MSDRELIRTFFDSTDAFFYIKDSDGHFLLVNKTGAAALGLSEAECVGKTAYEFLPKNEADSTTRNDRHMD